MLLVISPAKNLDYESTIAKTKTSQPLLLDQAEVLVDDLRKKAPHQLSKLMGISDKLGQLNYDRYQSWSLPFNKSNARPAVLAFNGDVYQGLDAPSMDAEDLAFAQDHLRILSGLYGCLRPLDLMQPYRLEMGTALKNERGKDLYQFWGDIITEQLNKQLKKLKTDTLVNLASNEYFKSVNKGVLKAEIIEPVFKDWKNGQYKIISFFAKKARGLMSAYIIKNRLTQVQDIVGFDYDGYAYSESLSDGASWVFTRKQ